MTTYKINFSDRSNRDSFAVDTIAATAGGDWTSSQDDFAIIENVKDEEYMEEILDNDDKVESWRKDN